MSVFEWMRACLYVWVSILLTGLSLLKHSYFYHNFIFSPKKMRAFADKWIHFFHFFFFFFLLILCPVCVSTTLYFVEFHHHCHHNTHITFESCTLSALLFACALTRKARVTLLLFYSKLIEHLCLLSWVYDRTHTHTHTFVYYKFCSVHRSRIKYTHT